MHTRTIRLAWSVFAIRRLARPLRRHARYGCSSIAGRTPVVEDRLAHRRAACASGVLSHRTRSSCLPGVLVSPRLKTRAMWARSDPARLRPHHDVILVDQRGTGRLGSPTAVQPLRNRSAAAVLRSGIPSRPRARLSPDVRASGRPDPIRDGRGRRRHGPGPGFDSPRGSARRSLRHLLRRSHAALTSTAPSRPRARTVVISAIWPPERTPNSSRHRSSRGRSPPPTRDT